MALDERMHAIILASFVLIVGIIHFGVGIGIVAKYNQYQDIFQQEVSLAGYNIFVGLCAMFVGILALISAWKHYSLLSKITAFLALFLGLVVLASLITALVLSSRAPKYLRDTVSDNMNKYAQDDDAINIIDNLQTKYQCCGVNLWLDWARVSLGPSNVIGGGRRRRHSVLPASPLTQALRRKRQIISPGPSVYNLPSSYSINLPLSCCRSGGTTIGNSLGGFCVFNANNGTSSFYVSGCLVPVAGIAFAQITGIAVINTWLTILAIVCFAKFIHLFPVNSEPNTDHSKSNEVNVGQQQHPQHTYEGYPNNNYNPNPYYNYETSMHRTYL